MLCLDSIEIINITQVKSELPSTFQAYRHQQHRWTCGAANLFRKMAWEIITNKVCLLEPLPKRQNLSCYLVTLLSSMFDVGGINVEETSSSVQFFLRTESHCSHPDFLVLLYCHPIVCHGSWSHYSCVGPGLYSHSHYYYECHQKSRVTHGSFLLVQPPMYFLTADLSRLSYAIW